jgi:hypothetical protein
LSPFSFLTSICTAVWEESETADDAEDKVEGGEAIVTGIMETGDVASETKGVLSSTPRLESSWKSLALRILSLIFSRLEAGVIDGATARLSAEIRLGDAGGVDTSGKWSASSGGAATNRDTGRLFFSDGRSRRRVVPGVSTAKAQLRM